MSLYGALYAGVAGLTSQSNKIGIISDNIANVNTVGYKGGTGFFQTLVTSSGTNAYTPGGVIGKNQQTIGKQGLLQTTDNPTDIAISGKGFFVVNSQTDGSGQVLYTRAGSFRQDSLGNFRNSAGFFLQGWPLDRQGRLPGESGNLNTTSFTSLSSLQTVNVQSLTGVAAATTNVEISANLDSGQIIYPGASGTADMDINTTFNFGIDSSSIIVPGGANGIERGDRIRISTGSGLNYTFRYDGFTYGRDVTDGSGADSGLGLRVSPINLATNPFATTNTSRTVVVTSPNHGLSNGDVVTFSNVAAAVSGIPAAELNQSFIVSNVSGNTFEITMPTTAATATSAAAGGSSITLGVRPFVGNILDATSPNQAFLSISGTTGFTEDSLSFTINTPSLGNKTFTYVAASPNSQLGQFNTLNNLADAISAVNGLSARVVNNKLYVSALDANESVTFANGSTVGDAGPPVKAGIDWIREMGFANIAAGTSDRFSTLEGLATLVNASNGLSATVNNPQSNATLTINLEDPLGTITFSDPAAAAALTAFTSATPFGTTSGSRTVSITHPSTHGFRTGDVVTVDPTGFAGYPAPFSATNAFATTNASTTVTVTQTAHGFSNGQVVNIDPSALGGFPSGNINGIPISAFNGNFVVSGVTANTYQITLAVPATSTGNAGTGNLTVSPTFNGIPMTDFDGQFTITVTSPSTYNITVANAATASGTTGATGLIITPPNNQGSLTAELGLVDSLNGDPYTPQTTGALGPAYDPTNALFNMASGAVVPQFFNNVSIFDSLGSKHDLRIGFIKTGVNSWAAEVFAVPASDVDSIFPDGQLGYGNISFNGDGSLRTVSAGLTTALNATWVNGASDSAFTIDWGTAGLPFGTPGATTIGKPDGLSQFDADYKLNFTRQDGVPVGQLTGVEITDEGVVVASYNNGETQNLFKIPIADFPSPDEMQSISGNVFQSSNDSGEVNLRIAGTNGVGKIASSALENSNVELSQQLTDMIVAQRAYQANTKSITTSDRLLEELNGILR